MKPRCGSLEPEKPRTMNSPVSNKNAARRQDRQERVQIVRVRIVQPGHEHWGRPGERQELDARRGLAIGTLLATNNPTHSVSVNGNDMRGRWSDIIDPFTRTIMLGYHRCAWSESSSTFSCQSLVPHTPSEPSGVYSRVPCVDSPAHPPTVNCRPARSGRMKPAEQKMSVLTCRGRQARVKLLMAVRSSSYAPVSFPLAVP
jgi:hypothetical protein